MENGRSQAPLIGEMDSGEKRLNELGYKQELRREMTLFKTLAISFSTMTLFTGITPLYGSSLLYAGPASLVWGWVVVSFFTWFVGIAMAEICSSFPVIGVAERSGQGDLQVYEFEYIVDSTRGGMKRIFSAAFVASKKLYLLNITHSDKPDSPLDTHTRMMLEHVLHSFDAAPLT